MSSAANEQSAIQLIERTNNNGQDPSMDTETLETCLKLLSGAWTTKILKSLKEKSQRFGELRRGLKTISSKVLTDRLREMEEHGVIHRRVIPTSPPTVEYSISNLGAEMWPVLLSMSEVAKKLKAHASTAGRN